MAPPLLSLTDCSLRLGPTPLFERLSLAIAPGERLTLLGRNGSGKSTLLKLIARLVDSDSGSLFLQPGTTVRYLPQEPDASAYPDLRRYIESGLAASEADEIYRAEPLMSALDIRPDARPAEVSGGELRRAALAQVLIGAPDILLLDEPTNHLDLAATLWLEDQLAAWRGAYVLVSHDRALLRRLARGALWLDRGQVRRFAGAFDDFGAWQEAELAREATAQHKLDRHIKAETRWSVEGISARRKRNMGRLRALKALRKERAEQIAAPGSAVMTAKNAATGGSRVFEVRDIAKSFGERSLFSGLSFRLMRGDRLGLIGPNGAGKTTLVKILLGEVLPDSGSVRCGTGLQPMIIDQRRALLNDNQTAGDVLTGGSGDWVVSPDGDKRHVSTVLKDFLFDPGVARQPVSALSGGERNRLLLARGLTSPSNLMILDEPTNDLDLDTLDVLIDLLANYTGTLLLISHDRDFLDQLVTQSLVLDGTGGAGFCAGGYSDARAQLPDLMARAAGQEQGGQAAAPGALLPAAPAAPAPAAAATPRRKTAPARLSYKDQRELDRLPAEIETLADKISALEAALGDPELFARDSARFTRLSTALAKTQEQLAAREERWLELEEKRETLSAGS